MTCRFLSSSSFAQSGVVSIEMNGVKTIGESAFYGCSDLKNVSIGDSLKTIGNSAFINCRNLEKIRLPKTLEIIYDNAFVNCTNLRSITCLAELPPTLSTNAVFVNVNNVIPLYVCNPLLYSLSNKWNYFANIQQSDECDGVGSEDEDEDIDASILNNSSEKLNIYIDDNYLIIKINDLDLISNSNKIGIYNINGSLLNSYVYSNDENILIDISDLASGTYLIQFNGEIFKLMK